MREFTSPPAPTGYPRDSRLNPLYSADRDAREFKRLPTRNQARTTRARFRVAGESGRADEHDMAIWEHGGLVYTWVGPLRPSFDAARERLQHRH